MTISITAAVGAANSKGEAATNKPDDVKKIQGLLKALHIAPMLSINGKCDESTVSAIRAAQELWNSEKQDGRIDPRGKTIARLNDLSAPLTLWPIVQTRVSNGGYQIRFKGKAPPAPYRLYLALTSNLKARMFVTPGKENDLISGNNLPALLQLMERANSWGRVATVKLLVVRDARSILRTQGNVMVVHNSHVISQSKGTLIHCPVKPYRGELSPSAIGADTDLKYTGNGTGRILHMPSINGDYHFVYDNLFETKNSMRGFDCTTYIGAVYGIDANTGALSGYGTKLAVHVGATKCDMEQKRHADIRDFFGTDSVGTYFMWSEGHIVIVSDGVVHEFTNRDGGGYKTCDVQDYPFMKRGNYWIRKVTASFGSFEPGITRIKPRPAPSSASTP